jgi:hypothetical protein
MKEINHFYQAGVISAEEANELFRRQGSPERVTVCYRGGKDVVTGHRVRNVTRIINCLTHYCVIKVFRGDDGKVNILKRDHTDREDLKAQGGDWPTALDQADSNPGVEILVLI